MHSKLTLALVALVGGCLTEPIETSGADLTGHASQEGANRKVLVCHGAGHGSPVTLEVDRHALAAHIAHGDELGACESGDPGEPPPDPPPAAAFACRIDGTVLTCSASGLVPGAYVALNVNLEDCEGANYGINGIGEGSVAADGSVTFVVDLASLERFGFGPPPAECAGAHEVMVAYQDGISIATTEVEWPLISDDEGDGAPPEPGLTCATGLVPLDYGTTDPEGDVTLDNADIIGIAGTVVDGVAEFRMQFCDVPFTPAFWHFVVCIDLDRNASTGTACGPAPGTDVAVSITYQAPGQYAPGFYGYVTKLGGSSTLDACAAATFEPETSTLRLEVPASVLGGSTFNYGVSATFGGSFGANEWVPDGLYFVDPERYLTVGSSPLPSFSGPSICDVVP